MLNSTRSLGQSGPPPSRSCPADHHRPRPRHPAAGHLAPRGPADPPLRAAAPPPSSTGTGPSCCCPARLTQLRSNLLPAGRGRGRPPDLRDDGWDGRASITESVVYRRLLPPEALRQLGRAVASWSMGICRRSVSGCGLVPLPPPGHLGHGRGCGRQRTVGTSQTKNSS
jgi:hypothetical protein